MVPPFVAGKDENYCLQINGNVLWEWRILEGNSKKLFAILQKNLQPNGYSLEKSAFDRVSLMLNTKTRTFVNKIKEERNGKRSQTNKAETWLKMSIYPEISQSPYDIFAEMRNEHEKLEETFHHLNATVEEKAAKLYEQMRDAPNGVFFSSIKARYATSAASERKTLTNRMMCLFTLNTIISLAQR